uniref:non-specific serine/threonine protein kinase n=1 Tax=Panagrellus redivivus TaxID=6233 RepID=A0A7E4VA83_PANRE
MSNRNNKSREIVQSRSAPRETKKHAPERDSSQLIATDRRRVKGANIPNVGTPKANTPRKAPAPAPPPPQPAPAPPPTQNVVPGEIPRGKNAPPHLATGQLLNGKFRIEKIIGSGGFGQIYKASDEMTRLAVAIKVVPCDHEPGRMILEQKVLIMLRNTPHAPHLIASGSYNGLMYIVMEMLGKNLADLRRKRKTKRLSVGTVLRAGQQAVAGLKAVHDVGYLHRDVKPSNMCIGLEGVHRRTIYIVDFGMTRQYRTGAGQIRNARPYAGFRGTMRYVSLTVHERKEQGPVDDFWSLFYTIVELAEGSVPWKQLTDPDDIARKKKITTYEDMCRYVPKGVKEFMAHLEKLQYHQQPNYTLLQQILQNSLPPDVSADSPFDWEENPSIVKSLSKSGKADQDTTS